MPFVPTQKKTPLIFLFVITKSTRWELFHVKPMKLFFSSSDLVKSSIRIFWSKSHLMFYKRFLKYASIKYKIHLPKRNRLYFLHIMCSRLLLHHHIVAYKQIFSSRQEKSLHQSSGGGSSDNGLAGTEQQ